MIQLVVAGVYLDLYDLDPPRLNFTIEDIRDTGARSTFSRTFRVPATSNNNGFFTNAFEINGVDFDITIKREATIYVDGSLFSVGQLRLNKIYNSREGARIDYECIFLGETKNFGTSVGDGYLNELDLSAYTHTLEYTAITKSWEAYPSGTTTDGLFEGDILYPLIDHGNTYTDGVVNETMIREDSNLSVPTFTKSSDPLPAARFKPMVRTKVIWDAIFEEAGYTYNSDFIDSDLFKKIYFSAFGNLDSIILDNLSNVAKSYTSYPNGGVSNPVIVPFNVIEFDYANNFNTTTHTYLVPQTGTYTISYNLTGNATTNDPLGGDINSRVLKNSSIVLDTDFNIIEEPQDSFFLSGVWTGTLSAGDTITIDLVDNFLTSTFLGNNSYIEILAAPSDVAIAPLLDKNYKKIDFIKDILTRFRLVMVPNKTISNNFIIEPWSEYIASGEVFNWTHKLDVSKDVVLEPVFFTQASRIEFRDTEGEDYLNKLNQDTFKEVFGQLIVNSDNDLLDGKRDITTNIIPTPITQIERKNLSIGDTFIIPQLHLHEPGENATYNPQHLPLRSNNRLLFYNGVKDTDGIDWYIEFDTNSPYNFYPMVSFYEEFPNNSNTLNLNWQKENGYIDSNINDGLLGVDVYTKYWSSYINSIYNGFARKFTAHFVLDSTDLNDFSFDDVIFVKNAYYYVSKIYNVPLGQKSSVKVDLIKLLNYNVNEGGFIPPRRLWNTTYSNWEDATFEWEV